jgi:mono/diheme cytochrome c family protein
MSFVEKPDRFGRDFLIAVVVWGAVGLVVFAGFKLVFPSHPINSTQRAALCTTTVPIGDYNPGVLADPVRAVVQTPSRCTARGSDPRQLLHAYLEGAELDSGWKQPRPPIDAALKARGAKLYKHHCATCHGATGDGKGPDACALDTPPAVHKNGVFALRTTEHEALPIDDDIFRTITRGVHGTAMPPWFVLPESDRWALVAHVKSLSKQFDEDVAPPPLESGTPPAATPERIAAGRALYTSAGCASCHGALGRGDGLAAESLKVKPRNFTAGRFHRGSSAADIHETLLTGLDGTPMASFAKVMSADDLWNVSIYVHTLTPALSARDGAACPDAAKPLDQQELFGVRALERTTHVDVD